MLGNTILAKVTGNIAKEIGKASTSSSVGGGAEIDGFNKTLTKLDIVINSKEFIYVVIFMTIVLTISLLIASYKILKQKPKELLIDTQ